MVARMALAIMSIAGGLSVSTYDTAIRWDKIDPRDEGEVAASLNDLVSGLAKAVESGIMSTQAASEFLAKQVDTMAAWISEDAEQPGERERIILNLIERRRAEDAALGAEKDAIDKILTAAKGGEA
jgi:hypothetical protein